MENFKAKYTWTNSKVDDVKMTLKPNKSLYLCFHLRQDLHETPLLALATHQHINSINIYIICNSDISNISQKKKTELLLIFHSHAQQYTSSRHTLSTINALKTLILSPLFISFQSVVEANKHLCIHKFPHVYVQNIKIPGHWNIFVGMVNLFQCFIIVCISCMHFGFVEKFILWFCQAGWLAGSRNSLNNSVNSEFQCYNESRIVSVNDREIHLW